MTNQEIETKRCVEGYFRAWTANRVDEAYALLADDLKFSGPSARYESAQAFRSGLVAFAAMTKGARIIDLIIQGDRAAMLYDCDLPDPVGTLRIASFFRVANGKIQTYETLFDATEFRKLAGRQARGE